MSYESRISRMREQGVLTTEQAERLSRSLGGVQTDSERGSQRNASFWIAAGTMLALLLVIGFYFSASVSPERSQVTHVAVEIQDVRSSLNQPEEIGEMGTSLSKGISTVLLLMIPLLLLLLWVVFLHNSLVSKEEAVFASWAQVESNYQRRADLIPNILETVSKYMEFEKETLTDVVGERAKVMGASGSDRKRELSESDMLAFRKAVDQVSSSQAESASVMRGIKGAPTDQSVLEQLYQAQNAVGASMHRILALSENYPVLRSADQMLTLQAELEGSENRINVARMRFNEAASDFNAAIRRMPASLISSISGFQRKAYFKADDGAEKAVKVKFE